MLTCPQLTRNPENEQRSPSPPPPDAIPEDAECHMKGNEHNFELLEGVEHGRRVRRYHFWSANYYVYICDECRVRLGQNLAE